MLKIIFVFAVAFLLQAIASMAQMKYFAKEFTEYRKQERWSAEDRRAVSMQEQSYYF